MSLNGPLGHPSEHALTDYSFHNSPVLIIEHPLDSYYLLGSIELELGSKSYIGTKFCPHRLKHIRCIDAIFPDLEQVMNVTELLLLYVVTSS